MFHKVVIIGNLGRDPELKYRPDGTALCDFSVASNRRWNRSDGTRVDETVWFRCTAWRKLAETVSKYCSKGKQVYIEGRLNADTNGSPRIWMKADNTPAASYEITVDTLQLLGGPGGGGSADVGDTTDSAFREHGESGVQSGSPATTVDDIPF